MFPVLFCVVLVGNNMDYWKCNHIKLSVRVNRVINCVLALLFVAVAIFGEFQTSRSMWYMAVYSLSGVCFAKRKDNKEV